ncbi:hypothetical protein ACFLIM_14620 [Nonomuraea sp. M3C6]|uniref:Uncharacterized protein n=1 Tax=Nonomuraea marmarensis TaxID=3351344 RepID=A0ABW7ADQ0_9ACTN
MTVTALGKEHAPGMIMAMGYDELIREALSTPFEGWDFAAFGRRMTTGGDLPWD